MRTINKIVVHHSASSNPAHDDISVIDRWHKQRGWKGVGYHYFIRSNGALQYGRDIGDIGAHVRGHNSDSIGICLHGNGEFDNKQFVTLRKLIESLDLALGSLEVYGHSDLDPAKPHCPGFNYEKIIS